MKRLLVFCICAGLIVLAAPMALAQSFLSMGWGDCVTDGGTATVDLDADNVDPCPAVTRYLSYAYRVGVAQPQFVGIEGTIDMQDDTNPADLGAWWQWANGCRTTVVPGVLADAAPTASGASCVDAGAIATAAATPAVLAIQRPSPGTGLGPNSQRVKVGWVLPSSNPLSLAINTDYMTGVLRVRSLVTADHNACLGCNNMVTITLNSIWSRQLPGAPGGDIFISDPLPGPGQGTSFSNCVTANQAASRCATGATPTEARTWGQLKSLYR
jgi:hypothetical protein